MGLTIVPSTTTTKKTILFSFLSVFVVVWIRLDSRYKFDKNKSEYDREGEQMTTFTAVAIIVTSLNKDNM